MRDDKCIYCGLEIDPHYYPGVGPGLKAHPDCDRAASFQLKDFRALLGNADGRLLALQLVPEEIQRAIEVEYNQTEFKRMLNSAALVMGRLRAYFTNRHTEQGPAASEERDPALTMESEEPTDKEHEPALYPKGTRRKVDNLVRHLRHLKCGAASEEPTDKEHEPALTAEQPSAEEVSRAFRKIMGARVEFTEGYCPDKCPNLYSDYCRFYEVTLFDDPMDGSLHRTQECQREYGIGLADLKLWNHTEQGPALTMEHVDHMTARPLSAEEISRAREVMEYESGNAGDHAAALEDHRGLALYIKNWLEDGTPTWADIVRQRLGEELVSKIMGDGQEFVKGLWVNSVSVSSPGEVFRVAEIKDDVPRAEQSDLERMEAWIAVLKRGRP